MSDLTPVFNPRTVYYRARPPYLGYDPRVNAQVTQEFSTGLSGSATRAPAGAVDNHGRLGVPFIVR
jgi:hypothetical protein